MKVNGLKEATNDDNIFNLVIGGRAKAYAPGVEQHMVRGVNGLGCRGKILGPITSFVLVPDVISERKIHLLTQGHWISLT
jgi:hypothetical protein